MVFIILLLLALSGCFGWAAIVAFLTGHTCWGLIFTFIYMLRAFKH